MASTLALVTLEHGLIGGDRLRVAALEEALAGGLQHAGQHLGGIGLPGSRRAMGGPTGDGGGPGTGMRAPGGSEGLVALP